MISGMENVDKCSKCLAFQTVKGFGGSEVKNDFFFLDHSPSV